MGRECYETKLRYSTAIYDTALYNVTAMTDEDHKPVFELNKSHCDMDIHEWSSVVGDLMFSLVLAYWKKQSSLLDRLTTKNTSELR